MVNKRCSKFHWQKKIRFVCKHWEFCMYRKKMNTILEYQAERKKNVATVTTKISIKQNAALRQKKIGWKSLSTATPTANKQTKKKTKSHHNRRYSQFHNRLHCFLIELKQTIMRFTVKKNTSNSQRKKMKRNSKKNQQEWKKCKRIKKKLIITEKIHCWLIKMKTKNVSSFSVPFALEWAFK